MLVWCSWNSWTNHQDEVSFYPIVLNVETYFVLWDYYNNVWSIKYHSHWKPKLSITTKSLHTWLNNMVVSCFKQFPRDIRNKFHNGIENQNLIFMARVIHTYMVLCAILCSFRAHASVHRMNVYRYVT